MNLSEINWDLENAGAWPLPIKAAIIALLCFILSGLWYYLDTQDQMALLETEERKELELKTKFEQRQQKAANLEEYKAQMAEIEKSFGDLLRQLPDKTQVPELLVDVSQTGLAAGLEFELFKPGAEIAKEFYAELPIEIRVIGDYMEFGAFVSGLASLPRIVTIHNVKIEPHKKDERAKKTAKNPLVMSALVRTYRYLDEGAVPASQIKKSR
ncbi:type IV pilus inner membrane component PilO [Methylocaldum szegediense]|uniref:Type IV pilus inner membrane component PilO n=1 Tax=Methylocaldum szegediense TaxID=73780 RepID=A0ABN8X7D7_9GAMM|nr:type 4a pilus biogenesis protein PilO [Methylocaldum szegediense]CAI8919979.1 Type IV pilus inner membrane component PilO [Methylocaldum szegediense]